MTILEQLARKFANSKNENPDQLMTNGVPQLIKGGYCVYPQLAFPLWHTYANDIKTLLQFMQDEKISYLDTLKILKAKY